MSNRIGNQITTFFHCRKCIQEMPKGEVPMTWSRIEVGFTDAGSVQVWCNRHAENIVVLETTADKSVIIKE